MLNFLSFQPTQPKPLSIQDGDGGMRGAFESAAPCGRVGRKLIFLHIFLLIYSSHISSFMQTFAIYIHPPNPPPAPRIPPTTAEINFLHTNSRFVHRSKNACNFARYFSGFLSILEASGDLKIEPEALPNPIFCDFLALFFLLQI